MTVLTLSDVHQAAREAHEAGLCVVPPRQDGSKAPMVHWRRYEDERPSLAQLDRWYGAGLTGLGIVCGPVSRNTFMFEAEDDATAQRLRAEAHGSGRGYLLDRLDAGYLERTPGDGVHWLGRSSEIGRNTKLARRLKRPEEMADPGDKVKVLIETRENGGYAILAPSHGKVHPSGRPYVLLAGGFSTIPTITPAERDALYALARSLDEMPAPAPRQAPRAEPYTGDSIADAFNARSTWAEILTPHGWSFWRSVGDNEHWSRPGRKGATSATINEGGAGVLYVFSSSTMFEPGRAYSRFGAYAVLNHAGDFSAAARAVREWWAR